MAPTPPSGDASRSTTSPGHEERTRRNVACVTCRNSKVRCRTSQVLGQPCQRCAKLQISCVVDKSHKRITKRSKLEQLEQELRSIKQVVNPTANADSVWTPPSPRINHASFQERPPSSVGLRPPAAPQVPTPLPDPASVGPSVHESEKHVKTGPTESRMLGPHVVSGEDIEWYFNKYLQCFHHYIPILRKKDPDECYEANTTLFWVIIYITCRRYTKDRAFFSSLVDHVGKHIWTLVADPAIGIDGIHALILLCAWPLPTIRLVTDSSTTLAGIAMNACMMLGLHTGRGSHSEFCVGLRARIESTDEEAASTWFACCVLVQRAASILGHPPASIQYTDTQCKKSLDGPYWADLNTTFELQKFLNRFLTSMASNVSTHGGVPDHVVSTWEDEFETLKPLMSRRDTAISRFSILAAQLEIQNYYFNGLPSSPSPTLQFNALKAFHTARSLITLTADLETRSRFLTHAPHGFFRSVIDAACVVMAILHSTSAPDMPPNDANVLAQQAWEAVLRCSVREGDLPYRGCVILETYWSIHQQLPKVDCAPGTWPNRLSAGVTHWCLHKFKDGLQSAQKNNEACGRKSEITQSPQLAARATGGVVNQAQPSALGSDPFQDVDWSMFMDDFGWMGDDSMLLGLPC